MSDSARFSPRLLLGRQYGWLSLLVVAGMVLLARLGFWQLDRLEQRRALNTAIRAELALPALSLNQVSLPAELAEHGYRLVVARGHYDLAHQVFLVQQRYQGQLGMDLITPLQIAGTGHALLVDRGWIPDSGQGLSQWPQFPQSGEVVVRGYIRPSQTLPNGRTPPPPPAPQEEWFRVDIPGIQAQTPEALLPFYIQALPESSPETGPPPYRQAQEFDLSEGPHLSYAIQWFSFALMLGGGYVLLLYRRTGTSQPPG